MAMLTIMLLEDDMYLSYVNPNLGGIGHLLTATYPTVYLPNCMVGIYPVFSPDIKDRYLADKISGFPVPTHLHGNADTPTLMPTTGPLQCDANGYASEFDHDFEIATPYYYSVLLEKYNIEAEYTVSAHCVVYRFTFTEPGSSRLLVAANGASLEVLDDCTFRGRKEYDGLNSYFYIKLNKQTVSQGTWDNGRYLNFNPSSNEPLEVKVGVSFISYEQAWTNLNKEILPKSFDTVKEEARLIWKAALSKIKVEGGTEKQKRTFYTALYRYMGRMQNITEDGKYYSAYDNRIHTDAHDFYVTDQLWDTFRSAHPLRILIAPQKELNMIRSYIRMYEQSGWLPRFPMLNGDRPCMLGHHGIAMIADAYRKGLVDFDVNKGYEGMKKSAMEATKIPWCNAPLTELDQVYLQKGFFPALKQGQSEWVPQVDSFEKRQAVAVTLESSYDDWCLAQMAKELGKDEDYHYFMKSAHNYKNLYNPSTGFMSPKSADGNWVSNFDPKLSGGQGGRDYFAECNAWTYTWSVQHDIAGLIRLMGGREKCVQRLDQLFIEQYDTPKFTFLGQFPDSTGLIGQFVTGNEPSFHIPYLYNFAGAPWKTQRKIRDIMKIWFNDGPLGLCGDEDGGAMSAWHVFNSMGFFPVCPGEPYYALGSPVFERITIDLSNGKTFVIRADNSNAQHKYIQSATLNGVPHDKPWFEHSAIRNGGELVLEMGKRPNKQWGSDISDAPPSMSLQ